MIDQHRTCAACEELYMAPRCNRFGHVMLDESDEPDDDGMTFADYCSLWTPRAEPTLEQRCQQLERLARDMYRAIAPMHEHCCEGTCASLGDMGWGEDFCCQGFREQLTDLGVILDD